MKSSYTTILEAELAGFVNPSTGRLFEEPSRHIECPLCEGNKTEQEELFIKRGFRFVLCPGCGLVFVNPQVESTQNKALYDTADSLKEWARILRDDSQVRFDLGIYSSILDLCKPMHAKKKNDCLDISMRGGLLSECEAVLGWNLEFLDFAGPTREQGRSCRPSFTFYNEFDQIKKLGKTYDVVISMEGIEHFSNPLSFARDVHGLLRDGGVFCGVLSNVESLLARLLGADTPMFDGLYQKFFFHSTSLSRALKLAGYRDVVLHSKVPCSDKIIKHLNRMTPNNKNLVSGEIINKIAKSAESHLLGYKMIFAARRALNPTSQLII